VEEYRVVNTETIVATLRMGIGVISDPLVLELVAKRYLGDRWSASVE